MHEELKRITETVFRSVLSVSAAQGGTFRLLITARVGEAEKPLLMVGNAHSEGKEGHVIAVFNPDEDLMMQVLAGIIYDSSFLIPGNASLKELVKGKCDVMIHLQMDADTKNGVREISSYESRTPKAAKFKIQ